MRGFRRRRERAFMSNKEILPYAKRLRTAREEAGKSREQMAALLGIIIESYWDLEAHDNEVLMCLSIHQLVLLCRTLNVPPSRLFAEEHREPREAISLAGLGAKIQSHIKAQQMALSEFGDRVGWDVEKMLDRPEERFNVYALRDVCRGSE